MKTGIFNVISLNLSCITKPLGTFGNFMELSNAWNQFTLVIYFLVSIMVYGIYCLPLP